MSTVAHNCHGKIILTTAISIWSRQNQFDHGNINSEDGKVIFTTAILFLSRDSNDVMLGAVGAYPTWRLVNVAVKIYFMRIVGLRSHTERISAFSVEKVCFHSLVSAHNAHLTLLSWQTLKPRAWIQKVCFPPKKASWEDYNWIIPPTYSFY